ncbi:hypothetical protein DL89DRAFT_49696 [Linderina pennispora]|uniref:Uncharacterized protein n=1 Tax=Linderina pennispora TaxID=61395 RepID=A0A1Y1VSG3_9FUNG|nr:uncharacterized protein DL89DRAFT_49696 [Linderina pennispora]ORX64113.1 hypothetical protein DL89DRAFT_49696 [Linderina pennispora]
MAQTNFRLAAALLYGLLVSNAIVPLNPKKIPFGAANADTSSWRKSPSCSVYYTWPSEAVYWRGVAGQCQGRFGFLAQAELSIRKRVSVGRCDDSGTHPQRHDICKLDQQTLQYVK